MSAQAAYLYACLAAHVINFDFDNIGFVKRFCYVRSAFVQKVRRIFFDNAKERLLLFVAVDLASRAEHDRALVFRRKFIWAKVCVGDDSEAYFLVVGDVPLCGLSHRNTLRL